jgi:hypothetical protein
MMTDEFKEAAEQLAKWWNGKQESFRRKYQRSMRIDDSSCCLELGVIETLDALVEAMPDPRGELIGALDEFMNSKISVQPEDGDPSMAMLVNTKAWERLHKAYQASMKLPKCEPVPLHDPDPKERIVKAARMLLKVYDARVNCTDELDILVAAVEAYKATLDK